SCLSPFATSFVSTTEVKKATGDSPHLFLRSPAFAASAATAEMAKLRSIIAEENKKQGRN
ncbi:hypothetical protein KKF61_05755, partial [Patescibacteria group bacterium]|nr:hypothetical protein [Patescibacteria group bacterium]